MNIKPYLNHLLIAIAIIFGIYLFSNAYRSRNPEKNTISVTGLGSKDFNSDLIVWSGSFKQANYDLKSAYSALNSDRETIRKYLNNKGVKNDQIVFSSIDINKLFDDEFDEHGNRIRSTFLGYQLTQQIEVESPEVDKVENISRQVTELINQGIEFYSNSPQYYYTKLAELKVEMIAEATKDANLRAEKIAENSNSSLGKLRNAEMGVFQIVAQNSSEDYSWGGSFNTTSKRKTASITVKLNYNVD